MYMLIEVTYGYFFLVFLENLKLIIFLFYRKINKDFFNSKKIEICNKNVGD